MKIQIEKVHLYNIFYFTENCFIVCNDIKSSNEISMLSVPSDQKRAATNIYPYMKKVFGRVN